MALFFIRNHRDLHSCNQKSSSGICATLPLQPSLQTFSLLYIMLWAHLLKIKFLG